MATNTTLQDARALPHFPNQVSIPSCGAILTECSTDLPNKIVKIADSKLGIRAYALILQVGIITVLTSGVVLIANRPLSSASDLFLVESIALSGVFGLSFTIYGLAFFCLRTPSSRRERELADFA